MSQRMSFQADADRQTTVLPNGWRLERYRDGVILVRVPSHDKQGNCLPDAVFSFRSGDPQYPRWAELFVADHCTSR